MRVSLGPDPQINEKLRQSQRPVKEGSALMLAEDEVDYEAEGLGYRQATGDGESRVHEYH